MRSADSRCTAPVDLKWLFRPSRFVIDSLRDHSTLSLVWVLSELLAQAQRSFLVAGPTWLGFDPQDSEADAEFDLAIVMDGQTVLCEVKSSWNFRSAEIDGFVALALRLKPSLAIFAVYEEGRADRFANAEQTLNEAGIPFRLMTPETHTRQDGVLLFEG